MLSDKVRNNEKLRAHHLTEMLVKKNILKEKDISDKIKTKKEKKKEKKNDN